MGKTSAALGHGPCVLLILLLLSLPMCARMPEKPGYTGEQVERGRKIYRKSCAQCHGTTLANGLFGAPLKGEYFREKWRGRPAAALHAVAQYTMPPEAPASLSAAEVADVLALILAENGLAPGEDELPAAIEPLGRMILIW
jgi:mono/diheme cytochrome c family protein